jgi:hypothetical protein
MNDFFLAGRRARGKFLMFTNPDDVPSEGLVKVCVRVFIVLHVTTMLMQNAHLDSVGKLRCC